MKHLTPSYLCFIKPGTVSDTKIKSLDNVARIVPKSECLPQMLTSGTVILDISYNRDELAIAMDYMKRKYTYFIYITITQAFI